MKTRTQASYDAVRRGHRRLATAALHTPAGYVADAPIHRGSLTKTLSSGQGQWTGSIEVPGYEWAALLDPSTNCWLEVSIAVDGEQWVLGTFPVLTMTEERPGGLIKCDLGDWSYRRVRAEAESAFTIAAGASVAERVRHYMSAVLPGTTTIAADDSAGAVVKTQVQQQVGSSVWTALTEVANQVECIVEVPSRSTVAIRYYDPLADVAEDITGTMTRMSTTVDAASAVNQVRVFMEPTAPDQPTYMKDIKITTGPYAWDRNGFGYGVVAQTSRVDTATQALADAEARRIFDRQAGVVRRMDLEVLPQPWLEAGDQIQLQVAGRTEVGMINTITYPLTVDEPMRMLCRDTRVR